MVRDFDGVAGLFSLSGGWVEGIVHIVVTKFNHVAVLENLNSLDDNLFCPQSAIAEFQLNARFIMSVEDLEAS
jgi:hypothetical protein